MIDAIINNCGGICQSGTSYTPSGNGNFDILDKWKYVRFGSMAHTITKDADVPTVAQAGWKIPSSILLTLNTPQAVIGAGDICVLQQRIEGFRWSLVAQRALTLSFWVKASLPGLHCLQETNSGLDRSLVSEYTINAADTWEQQCVSLLASPAAGTWDYQSGVGCYFDFTLASGTTYQAPAGSWQNGHYSSSGNQVNAVQSGATYFRVTDVHIFPAGQTPEPRFPRDDLALCNQYASL